MNGPDQPVRSLQQVILRLASPLMYRAYVISHERLSVNNKECKVWRVGHMRTETRAMLRRFTFL